MYGLPQAGIIANELLQERLQKAGYHQCHFMPGLYRHMWLPVTFTLVVEDFGVEFVSNQHANHLKKTLEQHYRTQTQLIDPAASTSAFHWNGITKIEH